MTSITNKQGEKFTFVQGMISGIRTVFETGVDPLKMPISGPMNNFGLDIDGVAKTLVITGQFFDTTSSVTSVNNIRSMKIMKMWFESILSGSQNAMDFESYLDEYSVRSAGSFTILDPVSNVDVVLPSAFVKTKVYLINFECDDVEGDVEKIPFTMSVWVSGI